MRVDAPGALRFSSQLPALCHLPDGRDQVTPLFLPVEISCCWFSFPQVFCLSVFFVCLTHHRPRANNISKTFCRNFECQNN